MKITDRHIKIQFVKPEQKICKLPHGRFREVRSITVTKIDGVSVEYVDDDVEWFPIGKLVYVMK